MTFMVIVPRLVEIASHQGHFGRAPRRRAAGHTGRTAVDRHHCRFLELSITPALLANGRILSRAPAFSNYTEEYSSIEKYRSTTCSSIGERARRIRKPVTGGWLERCELMQLPHARQVASTCSRGSPRHPNASSGQPNGSLSCAIRVGRIHRSAEASRSIIWRWRPPRTDQRRQKWRPGSKRCCRTQRTS